MILGIDAGGKDTKVMGDYGPIKIPSDIGEGRDLGEYSYLPTDVILEYDEKVWFAGTLARRESEYSSSRKGETKAHEDAKLRILLAISHYPAQEDYFQIVVGQPISQHNPSEKLIIKGMLSGRHCIKVNGIEHKFTITNVEVAAEAAVSFWCQPVSGLIRIIDIGSGTINLATLDNKIFVNKESETIPVGMDNTKQIDIEALSRLIINTAIERKWKPQDRVRIVGGPAEEFSPFLKKHFRTASVFKPTIYEGDEEISIEAVYANAAGLYQAGRLIYI